MNRLPADHGQQAGDRRNLLGRGREQVRREHGKVREHPDRQLPFLALGELREGRAAGVGDDRLLARQRLAASGVQAVFGNDGSPAWCTVGNPSRFFSYRRDKVTGRQVASICLL